MRLRENEDGTWSNAEIPLCDASVCGEGLESEHLVYTFAFGQDQDRNYSFYRNICGMVCEWLHCLLVSLRSALRSAEHCYRFCQRNKSRWRDQ